MICPICKQEVSRFSVRNGVKICKKCVENVTDVRYFTCGMCGKKKVLSGSRKYLGKMTCEDCLELSTG